MIDLYNLGVNIIGVSSLILAAVVACVYLLILGIKYALGYEIYWEYYESINPLKNRAMIMVLLPPVAVFVSGVLVALTWPVSLSLGLVFVILHLIRMRILHKQKMWETLKGS